MANQNVIQSSSHQVWSAGQLGGAPCSQSGKLAAGAQDAVRWEDAFETSTPS